MNGDLQSLSDKVTTKELICVTDAGRRQQLSLCQALAGI